MAFGLGLLKLLAKVALDRLIGSARTDEAVALFREWWSKQDLASRNREFAEAKASASDSRQLEKIVAEVVADEKCAVTPDQFNALTLSLSSFTALPDQNGVETSSGDALVDRVVRWTEEWKNVKPATRLPKPGTGSAKLFDALNKAPTYYGHLWQRAGFDSDPFLRTALRKWAKAGWVKRTVDRDGKERWFR